jgi:hypothetical protein
MIYKEGEELLSVLGIWWIEFTRYIRRSTPRIIKRDPDLAPALLTGFEEVLGWQMGKWDDIVGDYREEWSRSSKEDFEGATTYYPIPRR